MEFEEKRNAGYKAIFDMSLRRMKEAFERMQNDVGDEVTTKWVPFSYMVEYVLREEFGLTPSEACSDWPYIFFTVGRMAYNTLNNKGYVNREQ